MARSQRLISIAQVLPTWVLLGVFFLVPLWLMGRASFVPDEGAAEMVQADHPGIKTWQVSYWQAFQENPVVLWRSLWYALATTAICLVISYPVAYYIAIVAPRKWRNLLLLGVAIPFWTSFVLRTSAWKFILGTGGAIDLVWRGLGIGEFDILSTPTAVLIGLVYADIPFMILPLYASLEKLDKTLLEASADLGAGAWRTFWRVTVPMTVPGIIAGIVLVFIPSIGQYMVSDLLGGQKLWLAGNLIENLFMGNGENPLRSMGSAVSIILMSIVMVMLILYATAARKAQWTRLAAGAGQKEDA